MKITEEMRKVAAEFKFKTDELYQICASYDASHAAKPETERQALVIAWLKKGRRQDFGSAANARNVAFGKLREIVREYAEVTKTDEVRIVEKLCHEIEGRLLEAKEAASKKGGK